MFQNNGAFFTLCQIKSMILVSRLLGALCRCICDPQLNAASQEIRPAESLSQLLVFHLNTKSALQRIAVALVLCEWAALQKVRLGGTGEPAESNRFRSCDLVLCHSL